MVEMILYAMLLYAHASMSVLKCLIRLPHHPVLEYLVIVFFFVCVCVCVNSSLHGNSPGTMISQITIFMEDFLYYTNGCIVHHNLRCSPAFFAEERAVLQQKREKIRALQQRKAGDVPDLKDLPEEIPMPLVIGTKVTGAYLLVYH